jgi:HEAT repeat protein
MAKFELMHALRGLEDATPHFFKVEALQDDELADEPVRETAARVLSSKGDPKAVTLLKEILRLM